MALNLQRLFQWGKTPKPPHDLADQPFGHPNDGDDLDAELDRIYANDTDLEVNKLARDGSQAMTGVLDMDGNRITNLPVPSAVADPARKAELDAEITARQNADTSLETNKLSRDGSQAMTGNLNMDSKRIQNLPAPSGVTEPARKQELDDLTATLNTQDASFLKLDGSRAMTGNLDMGGNYVTNLQSGNDSLLMNVTGDGTARFAVRTSNSVLLFRAAQNSDAYIAVRDGYSILKRRYDTTGAMVADSQVVDNQNSPGASGLQGTAANPKTSSNEYLLHQGNSPGAYGLKFVEFTPSPGMKYLPESGRWMIHVSAYSGSGVIGGRDVYINSELVIRWTISDHSVSYDGLVSGYVVFSGSVFELSLISGVDLKYVTAIKMP